MVSSHQGIKGPDGSMPTQLGADGKMAGNCMGPCCWHPLQSRVCSVGVARAGLLKRPWVSRVALMAWTHSCTPHPSILHVVAFCDGPAAALACGGTGTLDRPTCLGKDGTRACIAPLRVCRTAWRHVHAHSFRRACGHRHFHYEAEEGKEQLHHSPELRIKQLYRWRLRAGIET